MSYIDYNYNNLKNEKKCENFFLENKIEMDESKLIKSKSSDQLNDKYEFKIGEKIILEPKRLVY